MSRWSDVDVKQRHLAEALGASTALISSWEGGAAVPPEDRLRSYARFFATRRSLAGETARLLSDDDLTPEEQHAYQDLLDELVGLRREALGQGPIAVRAAGELGGTFWFFPDRRPITILCTPFSDRQLGVSGGLLPDEAPAVLRYATNRLHPNYVQSLRNGDIDALLELVGHIRAENPLVNVQWVTYDQVTADHLTGHLVILGGGDRPSLVEHFFQQLELPVRTRVAPRGDEEFDLVFVVTVDDDGVPDNKGAEEEVYGPGFAFDGSRSGVDQRRRTVDGVPKLEYDVALMVRRQNPLNPSAIFTMCTGLFSRGTYGATRAFTDANMRSRNENYLQNLPQQDFWMLLQVPVLDETTITPDIANPNVRLRTSY